MRSKTTLATLALLLGAAIPALAATHGQFAPGAALAGAPAPGGTDAITAGTARERLMTSTVASVRT